MAISEREVRRSSERKDKIFTVWVFWQLASSEALDVVHQAMRSVLYHRICMVIKIAIDLGVLFWIVDFVVISNLW